MRNECQFSETPRECEGSRVENMPFTDNLRDDLCQSSEEKESFQRDKIVFPFLLDDGTLLYVADDSKFDDAGNPILNQNGELQPNCRFEKNGISYQTDSDGRICLIDGKSIGDDNGETYIDESGNYLANNSFTIDGVTYKTDDNGTVYSKDGKLLPNTTYELNGNIYTTDDKGRIVHCEAKPQHSPETPRSNKEQKESGGDDRRESDQGGHVIGRDLGGDSGNGNLIPMDANINQSDYKRMENEIKKHLDNGSKVSVNVDIHYSDDSRRPDKITVTVNVDGKDTVYIFDNNMDGSLMDEVPENGKETVQKVLEETQGNISSIKFEYDEDGNLVKVTVTITYTDESGKTQRLPIVIDNPSGGTGNESN